MHKVITARLRAFLFIGGVLSLTSCEALRNALTPAKTEVVITDTIYLPKEVVDTCLLYTSPSPRDRTRSRMPSSA